MASELNKRIATKILKSLSAGAVPRTGSRFIAVGRATEIESFVNDFDDISDGTGAFRIISANFGGGKSFLLSLMKSYALDKNFVVMDATLNQENLFIGNRESGLNLYSQLISNMSIKTRPEGNALESVLQTWIIRIQDDVAKRMGCNSEDVTFRMMEPVLRAMVDDLRSEPQSYLFTEMIYRYARAYNSKEDVDPMLRWFRGEYKTKGEVQEALGIRTIMERDKWFQYLRIWSEFVVDIGYSGLIVTFDEAQTVSKLTKKGRDKNYEFFLSMFNFVYQYPEVHLGIYTCMIPEAVTDERIGLYSNGALKSRFKPSEFMNKGEYGSGDVIELRPLSIEDLYVLLQKIRDIHEVKNECQSRVSDSDIETFLKHMHSRLGANEFLTPRDVLKNYITILDRMMKHPDESFSDIVCDYGPEREADPFDDIPDNLELDL